MDGANEGKEGRRVITIGVQLIMVTDVLFGCAGWDKRRGQIEL
jgi:hypothetical protein